jgi:hypothetical protein
VIRIAAPRKIRALRVLGEDAMSPEVNIAASVLLLQHLAVIGNQNGQGIRLEEQFGRHGARELIQAGEPNARVVQIDAVHQVMQSHVSIKAAEPGQKRKSQTAKSGQRIASERRKDQIEPDHIGFLPPYGGPQSGHAFGIVKGPATRNRKTFRLRLLVLQCVRQYGKADIGISLQLARNMIAVFA